MFDVFKPVLRLIMPMFLGENRSGSRSTLVAIFFYDDDQVWGASMGGTEMTYNAVS